jgi:hypothetical protein
VSSLEGLFSGALEQPAGTAREAWIKAACEGDLDLESELSALLAAHESASSSFLGNPLDSKPNTIGTDNT